MKRYTLLFGIAVLLSLSACGLAQKYSRTEEQSFDVGSAPSLDVENFAGEVTVRSGRAGLVKVTLTRRAAEEEDLDRLDVEVVRGDGGLRIKTDRPSGLNNVSVVLEIRAPADTRLDLRTGAGDVSVRGLEQVWIDSGAGDVEVWDVAGDVEVHTGAGDVDVRDVRGPVRLDAGAGSIDYEGEPEGDCRFSTGAGDIKLRLSASADVRLDLSSGAGEVDVEMDVDGTVSRREVEGVLGSGERGRVEAHTGAGDVDLVER